MVVLQSTKNQESVSRRSLTVYDQSFEGFVNQVRLITILQPERYPTEQSQVGLVGTLLTGQALS
jgi:hypothetical protein